MSQRPKVSVVLTTYNGRRYLKETVDSILTQTLTDLELIVVDDCSCDGTVDILRGYSDPRINLTINEKNLGTSGARNRGMRLARGDYIATTDQDDLSDSKRLDVQVQYLESHPEIVMVGAGGPDLLDGRVVGHNLAYPNPDLLHWKLFSGSPIVYSSICFRREDQQRLGLWFDGQYAFAEDFHLFHRFCQEGDVVILDGDLICYRKHPQANSQVNRARMVDNGIVFLAREYREFLGLDVSDEAMGAIWDLFIVKAPFSSRKTAVEVGQMYREALCAFLDKKGLRDERAKAVREAASREWWGALAAQAALTGDPAFLSAFDDIPELTARPPRIDQRLRQYAVIALARWRRMTARQPSGETGRDRRARP